MTKRKTFKKVVKWEKKSEKEIKDIRENLELLSFFLIGLATGFAYYENIYSILIFGIGWIIYGWLTFCLSYKRKVRYVEVKE